MERCERCAPSEPGGTFCAVCGSFLGWEQDENPPPPVRPSPPSRSDPPLPTARLTDVRTTITDRATDATAPSPADPDPTTGDPDTTTDRGSPAGSVEAVQPARPLARRPAVRQRPPSTQDSPGDVICPACGTGNPPERKFCRRCGTALGAQTAPSGRASWWRRLGQALLRVARRLWRPRTGGRGLIRRITVLLLAAALLAGLGYGVARLAPWAGDAIQDRFADPQPVSPVSVQASSQAGDHPAEAVVDGVSNSYWAPATEGAGQGEYVELTFAAPIRLLDLIVHSGVSAQRDVFLRQARPAELELTLWNSQGESESRTLSLADQAGPQTFHQVADDVVKARLTVRESYGSAAGRRTAIAEVEFFRRP